MLQRNICTYTGKHSRSYKHGNLQAYQAMKLSSHAFSALIVLGRFYHPVKFWG